MLTPRESLGPVDRDDWAQYAAGPRRSPSSIFEWAKVPIVNEWGDKCQGPNGRTGRQFCYTADLGPDFARAGGMPYVPWRAGFKLEGVAAARPRKTRYPPPAEALYTALLSNYVL